MDIYLYACELPKYARGSLLSPRFGNANKQYPPARINHRVRINTLRATIFATFPSFGNSIVRRLMRPSATISIARRSPCSADSRARSDDCTASSLPSQLPAVCLRWRLEQKNAQYRERESRVRGAGRSRVNQPTTAMCRVQIQLYVVGYVSVGFFFSFPDENTRRNRDTSLTRAFQKNSKK